MPYFCILSSGNDYTSKGNFSSHSIVSQKWTQALTTLWLAEVPSGHFYPLSFFCLLTTPPFPFSDLYYSHFHSLPKAPRLFSILSFLVLSSPSKHRFHRNIHLNNYLVIHTDRWMFSANFLICNVIWSLHWTMGHYFLNWLIIVISK